MSNAALTWAFETAVSPAAAKFVLVALADLADESHSCFPSQDRIAGSTGQSRDSVLRHLKTLEAQGFIVRQRRSTREGYRTSDRYFLRVGSPELPKWQSAYKADCAGLSGNTPENLSGRLQQEPSYDPSLNPKRSVNGGAALEESFGRFWAAYPRHVGKKAAAAAFARAVKRAGDAETVIEGAGRYAADPHREDAFTAHATTWLNRDGWEDESLPARRASGPRDRQGELLQREMEAARAADAGAARPALEGGAAWR